VLLEDDFSYGVATDKRHLKTMSDRAKSAVSTGSVDTSAHVKVDDFEAGKLLSQARVKIIPFLDTHEAAPINELVTML